MAVLHELRELNSNSIVKVEPSTSNANTYCIRAKHFETAFSKVRPSVSFEERLR